MGASHFFVINLFSGTAQESRTHLSVHDPVQLFHSLPFYFGVQFAKALHGLYSSGQAAVALADMDYAVFGLCRAPARCAPIDRNYSCPQISRN